ncbi:MAG: NAD-dependent DNA ligase LigA [Anaerovoracaceae bacterium]|jgi:DNA ligase (NAD+)
MIGRQIMASEEKKKEIREKVEFLNRAARAYYTENREIISNFEYDKAYDELVALEQETGIIMAGSPTQNVGYEELSDLPKEAHPQRMLSLNKTKSVAELASWLGDKEGLLSWKMDGLTVVLTFEGGSLSKAVTRGNGEVGEVITPNARTFVDLPVSIPFKGRLVVRGEAFITYSDFRRINESLPELDAKYKNPRNLCSGSVRQLNSRVTAERSVHFNAFTLAEIGGADDIDVPRFSLREEQMEWLSAQGFDTVAYVKVSASDVRLAVEHFAEKVKDNDMPSDGLVLIYNDIAYGESLGETAKFPRSAIAFKWRDEIRNTRLLQVEWSPSRTGLINPIAVFEPVELEGTTVSRASVHNVSIMRDLKLGIGDEITVYKANMIIPQIAENLTRSGNVAIPEVCPVCGGKTRLRNDNDVAVLYCTNAHCPAKRVKAFTLFASRDAMNIEGLSEMTIEKLTDLGYIREPADFFRLQQHRDGIVAMEGMGEKSYNNLVKAADAARETTPARLLYALGIAGIGAANARMIAGACGDNWEKIQQMDEAALTQIDGVGDVLAKAFTTWFADEENRRRLSEVLKEVHFAEPEKGDDDQVFAGMTFVITGSLHHFENRKQLKELIEARGGRVAGSVSGKTAYLINNDVTSTSSKNTKAKSEGIPIISEDDFLERFNITVN